MHAQPASPKKPCRVTFDGRHQWITLRRKVLCWICGAVLGKADSAHLSHH